MFIFNKHFGINVSWYIRERFTTNGLELKHRLQKKTIDKDGMAKEILETWIGDILITPKSDGPYQG